MKIELYQEGQEKAIHQLIKKVYDEFVAKDYSNEGNVIFYDWISPNKIAERQSENNSLWVASEDNMIVGMIEIKNNNHISLLFVEKTYQGRGIAKVLVKEALEYCKKVDRNLETYSVNASPFSIPIYEKLGFKAIKEIQETNGIIYLPMEMKINNIL